MLGASTACTFSTSQLPKVVRSWCVLYILTSKCASRHNGVHFSTSQLPKVVRTPQFLTRFTSKCASRHNGVQLFISHLPGVSAPAALASLLSTLRSHKTTKNTVFRDFPTFSRTCIFFLLIFSLLTLLPADCFFISPYCRKFDFQTSFDNIAINKTINQSINKQRNE